MENMPLHVQAQNYMACNGNLDHFSLGRICISTKRYLDDAFDILKTWKSEKNSPDELDPTQLIFNAIIYFSPLYLYRSLQVNQELIKNYVDYKLSQYPGISYTDDIQSFIRGLDGSHFNKLGTNLSLYAMIVRHKVILGFLLFLNESYSDAINNFEWVLQFLGKKLKNLRSIIDRNASLSSVTQSIVTVLLCHSYSFGNIYCNNQQLNELFVSLISVTKIRNKSEYSCGRLSTYFIAFGLLHEKGAINQASKITIEDENQSIVSSVSRLDSSNLEEMIRKYILAATNRAHDDPSTIILYDRIIWGILLCGGLHLKTLCFFILLKNHFFIEYDFGPLHIFPNSEYTLFPNDDILSQYENAWELLDKIFNLWNTLTPMEKGTIWDPSNGNMFLIPQIFDGGNKLILVDSFYDEYLRNTSANFVLVSEYQVKHKLKGHIKLQGKIISERIEISKELVSLWYSTYEECHGVIPDIIADFLNEF